MNPMRNARKMNLKAFLMSDKLVVEKDGKRNLYTYDPTEEGLKVLKTTFKLELPLLLNVEEDQADDDEIEENNAYENGRPIDNVNSNENNNLNICLWNADGFVRFKNNQDIIKHFVNQEIMCICETWATVDTNMNPVLMDTFAKVFRQFVIRNLDDHLAALQYIIRNTSNVILNEFFTLSSLEWY